MAIVAQSITPLSGFQNYWGDKIVFISEYVGPVLYATGGVQVNASDIGMKGFDAFDVMGLSYSGTYYCHVQYLAVDAAPSDLKGQVQAVKLVWMVLSTNAEAGAIDLSGEIVRFFAAGN